MAQNFMFETSTILYSITEQIHQLEREQLLSEDLQKHQSSIISFMFIHSLISENGKNVPLIVCDFHTK